MPGWTSRFTSPISGERPVISAGRDRRRCGGRCSRRPSPPHVSGARTASTSPQAAERLGANRACLSVARKLLKRSYHVLRELGEEALAPA